MSDKNRRGEEHPRGTLALTIVLGALMLATYFGIYFFIYVPRGAVTP